MSTNPTACPATPPSIEADEPHSPEELALLCARASTDSAFPFQPCDVPPILIAKACEQVAEEHNARRDPERAMIATRLSWHWWRRAAESSAHRHVALTTTQLCDEIRRLSGCAPRTVSHVPGQIEGEFTLATRSAKYALQTGKYRIGQGGTVSIHPC